MKSDVPSAAPAPPPFATPTVAGPVVAGARPLADARSRSEAELAIDLDAALRAGRSGLELSPAADGTSGVASLVAVWLINEVGKAIGVSKPVDLSKVTNREDLRSVGGVARLLHRAFHPAAHGAVA